MLSGSSFFRRHLALHYDICYIVGRPAAGRLRWMSSHHPISSVRESTLPLEGIKVLDMTRILAGVSSGHANLWLMTDMMGL